MKHKTEKPVPVKAAPQWGPLSLPLEQLTQMSSKFGLNYNGVKVSPVGVFSLPTEQLVQAANKFHHRYPKDTRTTTAKATFSGMGHTFSYRDLHETALRNVASTKGTGAPTVGKKEKSAPAFSFYSQDVYKMAAVYGPLTAIYGPALNLESVPVVKPTAPTKSTKSESVPTAKPSEYFGYTSEELHQLAWDGLNFTAVAGATSASIVAVQSPLKSVIVNLSRNGTFVPPYAGGFCGLVKALYAGTSASLSGSAVRTVYVTAAKKLKPVEGGVAREEAMAKDEGRPKDEAAAMGTKKIHGTKALYVMSVAFGDILATQIFESRSMLAKVPGLLPKDFKWYTPYNAARLMAGGFGPRYAGGMVNFTSLCLLEEGIADALPIKDKKAKHALAGAFSGATAAFVGYPLAAFKDYTLVRGHVTTDGRLVNKSSVGVLKEMVVMVRTNPEQALRSFASNALKQMPMRVAMTSAIFAIVAGVGEAMGPEPLQPVVPKRLQPPAPTTASSGGLFSGSAAKARDKVTPSKQDTPEDGPTSGPM